MAGTESPNTADHIPEAALKKRPWWARACLGIAGFMMALMMAETASRLATSAEELNRARVGYMSLHVNEGYELVPNSEEGNIRINSTGHRDHEYQTKRMPGATRITLMGDSVVFGIGVDVDKIFAKRLEDKLKAAGQANVEIINGGNPDTGLSEQLRIFKKRDLPLKPDHLLLCFYMNDSRPPMGFRAEFVRGDPIVRMTQKNRWLQKSVLYSTVYSIYYDIRVADEIRRHPVSQRMMWLELFQKADWRNNGAILGEMIDLARFDWGAAWVEENWTPVKRDLANLADICRTNGIKVSLCPMPVSVQVYSSTPRDEPQQVLRKMAGEFGWGFSDVLPSLRKHRDGPPLFNDHCHYNVRGHNIVAAALADYLMSEFLTGGK